MYAPFQYVIVVCAMISLLGFTKLGRKDYIITSCVIVRYLNFRLTCRFNWHPVVLISQCITFHWSCLCNYFYSDSIYTVRSTYTYNFGVYTQLIGQTHIMRRYAKLNGLGVYTCTYTYIIYMYICIQLLYM